MVKIVLALCGLLAVAGSDNGPGMPLIMPLITEYPCKDVNDITVMLDPGFSMDERNRYYMVVHKVVPANSTVEVSFSANVNIVFTVRTTIAIRKGKYIKSQIQEGDSFTIRFSEELRGFSFKVQGTAPQLIPYLTSFSIDDVPYCNYPDSGYLDGYLNILVQHNNNKTKEELQNQCGRRKVGYSPHPPVNGPTQVGDWPWHAAVYEVGPVPNGTCHVSQKYICGGTLIANNFVLTVAHCVVLIKQSKTLNALVGLGKYHLERGDENSVEMDVEEIIIHENYQLLAFDVALLKLKSPVEFTDYIQPACLWRTETLSADDAVTGTLVGWGTTNEEDLSQTLQQVNLPLVAHEVCVLSNLRAIVHLHDAFCAGYHNNGTSPCTGDSGGAFQIFVPHMEQNVSGHVTGTWHVRGVLSKGLRSDNPSPETPDQMCDENQYAIFTDTTPYIDWILDKISYS
ncbi:ovochymase-2 [Bicyclus anynana]|uniref:Ovochymase-2 n=1 Tax=Bicyclus anynana TaxID=110368 RepID=A0A6J1MYM4_BICAN|nr:ovochymase-2 [Bicyclus anynana]